VLLTWEVKRGDYPWVLSGSIGLPSRFCCVAMMSRVGLDRRKDPDLYEANKGKRFKMLRK
jgi:hypothetical protein